MEEFSPKILIVSGEASGDMYAAALAEEIKKKLPSARMFGLGGEKSRIAGIELIEDPGFHFGGRLHGSLKEPAQIHAYIRRKRSPFAPLAALTPPYS